MYDGDLFKNSKTKLSINTVPQKRVDVPHHDTYYSYFLNLRTLRVVHKVIHGVYRKSQA